MREVTGMRRLSGRIRRSRSGHQPVQTARADPPALRLEGEVFLCLDMSHDPFGYYARDEITECEEAAEFHARLRSVRYTVSINLVFSYLNFIYVWLISAPVQSNRVKYFTL